MYRQTEIPQTIKEITARPVVNPSQITVLYEKVSEKNGTTKYNTTHWWCKLCKIPLCAVYRSKTSNNKVKSISCLVEHKSTYDPKKYIYFRARKDSRGKQFPALLQIPFITKNDDGDDDECESTNVESYVQPHENKEVG